MPRKKLSDKLNQPAKIVAEKKISLVKASASASASSSKKPESEIARVSLRPRTSSSSSSSSSRAKSKKETFLVRLKIDKKTYQKVFKGGQNDNDSKNLKSSN